MITIRNMSKSFDKKTVFCNADITVESGSICGLVGVNGAGKSTLLRLIGGVLKPDAGSVCLDGECVYRNESAKKKVFFLPDDPYYDVTVTGAKLRELYRIFYPFDDRVFQSCTQKFSLDLNTPIRNFSKGMKRQLYISAALACRPTYLLLDEAFDGLDPLTRLEFKRELIGLQESGSTVVIASHALRELEDICDGFILLDNASVQVCGRIERALSGIFKLQIAFAAEITREDLPFDCIHFSKSGRVITAVGRGDKQDAIDRILAMHPVLLEEIPMDFEDLFIEEMKSRGYLQ